MGISQGFVTFKLHSFKKKKKEGEGGRRGRRRRRRSGGGQKFLRHVTVLMRLLSRWRRQQMALINITSLPLFRCTTSHLAAPRGKQNQKKKKKLPTITTSTGHFARCWQAAPAR